MPMYNLTIYRSNYPKSLGGLWKYYRREPFLDANDTISIFLVANNDSSQFKFKIIIIIVVIIIIIIIIITSKIANVGRKDVEIMVLLKYLSRNTFFNCKINLIKLGLMNV